MQRHPRPTTARWTGAAVAAAVLGSVVGLASPTPAGAVAGPIVVTTTADVLDDGDGLTSLREAVAMIAHDDDGSTTIQLEAGATYHLTRCDGVADDSGPLDGDLDVQTTIEDHFVAIVAVGAGPRPTITQDCDAESAERVLESHGESVVVHLQSLVITGGQASGDGGAVRSLHGAEDPFFANGYLSLDDVEIVGNRADGDGGGVAAGWVQATDTFIHANEAGGDGGGMRAVEVFGTESAEFSDNVAGGDGGGLFVVALAGAIDMAVRNNAAGIDGGGLWVGGPSDLQGEVRVLEVRGNEAGRDGGGVALARPLVLFDLVVAVNRAARHGGGIAGPVQIEVDTVGAGAATGTVIEENVAEAGAGGGLWVPTPDDDNVGLALQGVLLRGNEARLGGGMAVGELLAELESVTLTDNRATDGPLHPDLADDAEAGYGGGLALGGTFTTGITNLTVHDNTADVGGGGVAAGGGTDLNIDWSTLTANAAPDGANLYVADDSTIDLGAVVLAEPDLGDNCRVPAPVAAAMPSWSTDASCQLGGASTNDGGDPHLGPLTAWVPGVADPDPDLPPLVEVTVPHRVPDARSPLRGAITLPAPSTPLRDARRLARLAGVAGDIGAVEQGELVVQPIDPTRALDTRLVGHAAGAFGPGEEQTVQLDPDAVAAAVNITIVGPSAGTHLTAWPDGEARPNASVLNAPAGRTIAAAAVVPLSDSGVLRLRNQAGDAHVLVDVVAYVTEPSDEGLYPTTIAATRAVDTRGGPKLGAGEVGTVDLDAPAAVPDGVDAVLVTLTATDTTASTHLTAWETGTPRPPTSTLNTVAGDTTANLALVALDDQGRADIRNQSGETHVIVDVVAYLDTTVAAGTRSYHPLSPTRAFDSRATTALSGGTPRTVAVRGVTEGLPTHATAVIATLTIVGPDAAAHLTAWATGTALPPTSNLNAPAGVTRANLAVIPLGTDGQIDLRISSGTAHVLVDVVGYL